MSKLRRKKTKNGVLFSVCLKTAKILSKKKKVVGNVPDEPCIFLCRHLDSAGVISSLTTIPAVVRPWCLDCFMSYRSSIKHFRDYTFSKRFQKGKFFSAIASLFVGTGYCAIAKSAKCIPVYRGEKSSRSIQTIKTTVRALENGENILIYNDIDYADTDTEISSGEIFHGFIAVDKMFYRRNGKRVPIVPVFMDKASVVIHPPVYCDEPSAVEKVKWGMYNRE